MPNISIVVPEVQQSVLRPVVIDIVKQLEKITKITSDSVILFPGELNKTYQPGSGIAESNTDRTQFYDNEMIQIEVEEDFHKDSVLTTAVSRLEQLPIFCDDKIGVLIKPVYATTEISINFKFRSKSKTTIQRWRDDIRMRTSMSRDINLHEITYSYLIPGEFINILNEIHRLREAVEPYNENFDSYLGNNSSTRLTKLSNQSGTTTELGIAETQMRIVGYFDFEGFPDKPDHEDDTDTWIGVFAYKFTFEKPIACNMRYPVMIHNQILSTNFRPSPEDTYDLDNHLQSYSLSINAFNYFEAQTQLNNYVNPRPSITIPNYDEFIPNDIVPGSVSIFNALCQLTATDKKTLINLKELGDVIIDSDILKFIQESEWPFLNKVYQSILHVSIYRSMVLANESLCEVKSNLDVCSKTDLDIRVNHRIRFSIIADITLINPTALNRLKKYPKALVKIIQSVNEGLRNNPGFKDLGNKNYIGRDDIFKYILNPTNKITSNFNINTSSLIDITKINNDKYLLTLLNDLLKDIILIIESIKICNCTEALSPALVIQTDINDIIKTLNINDYDNLLFRLLLLKESFNALICFESSFQITALVSDTIKIINIIQRQTGDRASSIINNFKQQRFTVMTTNVIAKDGLRSANIKNVFKDSLLK